MAHGGLATNCILAYGQVCNLVANMAEEGDEVDV